MYQLGKYSIIRNNDNSYSVQWRDPEYSQTFVIRCDITELEWAFWLMLMPKVQPIMEAADLFHELAENPSTFSETEKGNKIINAATTPQPKIYNGDQGFKWCLNYFLEGYNIVNECNLTYSQLEPLCQRDLHFFKKQNYVLYTEKK
jgi:hypothetical protein